MTGTRSTFARFLVVGPFGTALGALQYELLWRANPLPAGQRAWTTWSVSSALGIAWIHGVHCHFTFRRPLRTSYLATLPRAYAIQGGSALAGAFGLHALTTATEFHHLVSWAVVTAATSALNFLALQRLLGDAGR